MNTPGTTGPAGTALEDPPLAKDEGQPSATRELATAAKEQLQTTGSEIKESAAEALQSAKAAGEDFFRSQKQQLTQKLEHYRDALRSARGSFEGEELKILAAPADRAIRALDTAGRYLSQCDRKKVLQDAADLARRKPDWIFGALFVAGLAGARFLKAATPRPAAPPGERPVSSNPENEGARSESTQITVMP